MAMGEAFLENMGELEKKTQLLLLLAKSVL